MSALKEADFHRMVREVWEDCDPLTNYTVPIPEVLRPYVQLDEEGRFAGFDRSDGVVDAYEREALRLMREASANLWAQIPRPRHEVI